MLQSIKPILLQLTLETGLTVTTVQLIGYLTFPQFKNKFKAANNVYHNITSNFDEEKNSFQVSPLRLTVQLSSIFTIEVIQIYLKKAEYTYI